MPYGGVLALTQKLLKHLAVVEVFLQLFHNDALLCQHVVDPVQEHLGEVRGMSELPEKAEPQQAQTSSCPNIRGLPGTCLVTMEDNGYLLVHDQSRSGEPDPCMELGLPNSPQQSPDRIRQAGILQGPSVIGDTYLPAEELKAPLGHWVLNEQVLDRGKRGHEASTLLLACTSAVLSSSPRLTQEVPAWLCCPLHPVHCSVNGESPCCTLQGSQHCVTVPPTHFRMFSCP